MNDPTEVPVNVDDMIHWINDFKARTGKSWNQIARLSNIPFSTISMFGTEKYQGDYQNIARKVFAFKQKVDSQEQRTNTILAKPDYVEIPTSRRLTILLEMALMGRVVVAAMGSGTSKTMAAEHFQKCMGETVYLVTLRESTGDLMWMIRSVMRQLRLRPNGNSKAQLSEQIIDHVRGSKSLIIFDEANFLTLRSIEEIRAWHDATGVGIALLGNEELEKRLRGGRMSHQYARIVRRIRKLYVQDLLAEEDITPFLDAAGIDDPKSRRLLIEVGTAAGHGGLGEVQQILEDAHMLAIGEDKALEYEHVHASSGSRVTQILRRAA
ncbi:AAA family ATPase [Sphingomonas sp. ERG5]|uniref:AAA family ATPase n=1 Tax=Sphingomonas sp. ERG5 TaxID=1381597 RepID=UPI00054AFCD9|nr:AAA family ATPase [Sphingomonas sp. ERG5]